LECGEISSPLQILTEDTNILLALTGSPIGASTVAFAGPSPLFQNTASCELPAWAHPTSPDSIRTPKSLFPGDFPIPYALVIVLDAISLNLVVRVILLNVEKALFNKTLYLSLQYPFAILGDPNNMLLVVVRPMCTESAFHVQILSFCIPQRQAKERFHPRAYARGPQLLI